MIIASPLRTSINEKCYTSSAILIANRRRFNPSFICRWIKTTIPKRSSADLYKYFHDHFRIDDRNTANQVVEHFRYSNWQ